MSKISIIVPVYNSELYLKRCLDSLLNQTLKDIEIIVVNDGSTDNSLDIINSYNKNIKVINHQKNEGIGKSRNDALKIVTGEYVGFVDSDDYVALDMFEKYYEYAKENDLDIVIGHYFKVINNNISLFETSAFEKTNYKENPQIINLIDLGPCNKIFKRDIIIMNKISFEEHLKFEDVPFVLKNLYHAKQVAHINKPYYYYCIRNKSETTTVDSRTKNIFDILRIINEYYKKYSEELEYLNIRETTLYMLKQKYQKDKNEKKAFIDYGYKYLSNNYPNWKQNKYYLKELFLKRMIKNNKSLLKIYCLFK